MFAGLQWSAIIRGAVLDNVLTFLALVPIVLWLAGTGALSGDPESVEAAIDRVATAPEFLLCSFLIGIAITAYAGFWAARRAGAFHLRHGGWTAVASAALAVVFLLIPGASTGPSSPWWYDAVAYASMLPAGVLGGWLASRRARS
jgi:hypothetical protein